MTARTTRTAAALALSLVLAVAVSPASAQGEAPATLRTHLFTAHLRQVSPGYTIAGVPVAVGDPILGVVTFDRSRVDFHPEDPTRGFYYGGSDWSFTFVIRGTTVTAHSLFVETTVFDTGHERFRLAGSLGGGQWAHFEVLRQRDSPTGGSDAIPVLGGEILSEPAWKDGILSFTGGSPLTYASLDHLERVGEATDLGPLQQALAALGPKFDALQARLDAMNLKLDQILAGLPGNQGHGH